MPTFPTYRGELPTCLSPLNPRHYLLLAYWVFFRPTALKCYLYQAAPEIYRNSDNGFKSLRHLVRVPAYRNLFGLIPMVVGVISVILLVPIACGVAVVSNWYRIFAVNWLAVAGNVALAVVVGMVSAVVFVVAVVAAVRVVGDVVLGVAGGVALGVAGGVLFGVIFGIISNTISGTLNNTLTDLLRGIAGGVAFGTIFGVSFSVVFGISFGINLSIVFSIIIGILFGVLSRFEFGIAFGMTGAYSAMRSIFYLVQLPSAWLSRQGKTHPVEWDELGVFPLPYTRDFLLQRLQQDEMIGLALLAEVARSPFQRWAVQSALQLYLHAHPRPLYGLYRLLDAPELDGFVFAPVRKREWDLIPSICRIVLADLNDRWIESGPTSTDNFMDRLTYYFTRRLRDRRVTPLTRFAGMLHDLLAQQKVVKDDTKPFDLKQYCAIYEGVQEYPGGAEIAHSFATMASYLACQKLTDIAEAPQSLATDSAMPPQSLSHALLRSAPSLGSGEGGKVGNNARAISDDPMIRPAVWATLGRLATVSDTIAAYHDSSSRANKQAALLRATDALKALDQYVQNNVVAPEQYLLQRIIRQWQALIIAEGGVVGRATERGPVANPYILNNPAEGERFVGRDDIMRRLEELWSPVGQVPSVVIYGHRRMGKTSILHNLGRRFGAQTVIVDFNMQRVGRVASDADLLYQLALHIYDECVTHRIAGLDEPSEQEFPTERPYLGFTRFLKRLEGLRGGRRIIVTVDEFEKIEAQIAEGKLTPALLEFWRGSFMTYPWFVLAFAGLYSLEERRHDYWSPLFGSVTGIKVSFLTPGAARRLITEPTPDFDIDYDEDAIAQIIALTGGQPFLVQLIGHTLVTRFNQLTYEEGREQERRFHLADIEQVINAPEFDRDGNAYFSGVWWQAEHSDHGGQLDVLRALAPHSAGLPLEDLAAAAGLAQAQAHEALNKLRDHDVVVERDGRYMYTVELMRRWALRQQN